MQRALNWVDYIKINVNFFALSARSQTLAPLVVPLLVQQFVGEDIKGTTYGMIRLWALMAGLLSQAFFGLVSDRTRSRWGRRRIYVAAGTLSEIVLLLSIGMLGGMQGAEGIWLLLALYVLSSIASNISNAGTLGFIPDLVPPHHHGLASGIKVLFEVPLPLLFVALVIGRLISQDRMMPAMIVLVLTMLACLAVTLTVREEAYAAESQPITWKAVLRLAAMTALFTGAILGAGLIIRALMPLIIGLSPAGRLILGGGLGLLGMALVVGTGVWLSLWVSLGEGFQANRSFTWWVINRLAWLTASNNVAGFLLFTLQERFPELQGRQAAGPVANILLIAGVATLVSALSGGWLADRMGKKPLVALSSVLAAAGTLVLILAAELGQVYASGGILGAGVGLFYSANWALGTQLIPPGKAGAMLGLSNLAGAGAGAVGAYLGGPIADGLGYTLLMSILGLLFLLSNAALLKIKEPRLELPG